MSVGRREMVRARTWKTTRPVRYMLVLLLCPALLSGVVVASAPSAIAGSRPASSAASPSAAVAPTPTGAAGSQPAPASPVVLHAPARLSDAFVLPGANACSWTIGSTGIQKTFVFGGGTYVLSSFLNTLTKPARQYVDPATVSPEFKFTWDGTTLDGNSGGWRCVSGQVETVPAGGLAALQLNVTLSRPQVRVSKHYLIYPHDALIREWVTYQNVDSVDHTLAQPSYLEQNVMGDRVPDVDLLYMFGSSGGAGSSAVAGSYGEYNSNYVRANQQDPEDKLQIQPMSAGYTRTFNAEDNPLCSLPGTGCLGNYPVISSSQAYETWFGLWDGKTGDGIYTGSDYSGIWAAPIGAQNGRSVSLSWEIPNYNSPLRQAPPSTPRRRSPVCM